MAAFTYKAIDATGKEVAATLNAPSRAAALDQLSSSNLYPVTVNRAEEAKGEGEHFRVRRISKRDVEAFIRELANLLAAGIPLSRALSILSREASRPATKRLWAAIHDQVAGGQSLAEALGRHPRYFPPHGASRGDRRFCRPGS